jgi:hypothetical protein
MTNLLSGLACYPAGLQSNGRSMVKDGVEPSDAKRDERNAMATAYGAPLLFSVAHSGPFGGQAKHRRQKQ